MREETKRMESIDKAIYGMVSESSGRNESERIGYLEMLGLVAEPHMPRDATARRELTDAARHTGGAIATAR